MIKSIKEKNFGNILSIVLTNFNEVKSIVVNCFNDEPILQKRGYLLNCNYCENYKSLEVRKACFKFCSRRFK